MQIVLSEWYHHDRSLGWTKVNKDYSSKTAQAYLNISTLVMTKNLLWDHYYADNNYFLPNTYSHIFFPWSWLLQDPKMEPRSMYHPFIEATEQYFNRLLPILVPLQVLIFDLWLSVPWCPYTLHTLPTNVSVCMFVKFQIILSFLRSSLWAFLRSLHSSCIPII